MGVCRGQRLTSRKIAAELGESEDWVNKVLRGHARRPVASAAGLATLTACSENGLFARLTEPSRQQEARLDAGNVAQQDGRVAALN